MTGINPQRKKGQALPAGLSTPGASSTGAKKGQMPSEAMAGMHWGNQPHKSRGQMLSAELVLASGMFIVAMVIFMAFWTYMQNIYLEEEQDRQMQTALLSISDMAVLSPGDPSNWEAGVRENASAFGMATAINKVSQGKFSTLQSLNASYYSTVKERMGAGRFELFMWLNNSTSVLYSFGAPANTSDPSVQAVSTERLAVLNNSIVSVRVQLWRLKGRAVQ